MNVKTVNGTMVEISHEEAERIATVLGKHPIVAPRKGRRSEAYARLREAAEAIGVEGLRDCEDDMKELLAHAFTQQGIPPEIMSEITYEMMEYAADYNGGCFDGCAA